MLQLEQLSNEKAKLHKEKVDLENQLEAEQVIGGRHGLSWLATSGAAAAAPACSHPCTSAAAMRS
jgi:hypothetical protein